MQRFSRNALPLRRRILRIGLPAALIALAALFMRRLLGEALTLILGAAAVAFLLEPLTRVYERRLARPRAALAAMGTVLGALAAAIWLLLPSLIQEATLLARQLPESLKQVQSALASASAWLEAQLPGVRLPEPQLDSAMLSSLAGGTLSVAGSVADFSCLISLMFVLGYFFLCDRDRLLIRMELLVPRAVRPTAVRMGNAVCRELRLYLRGQGLIALAVGALAAVGLALIGLRSALVLGVIVGVLNMIPYFGPVLGGIPAVLAALGGGWKKAALTVFVLWAVQQADGMVISPRILGGVTGLSPAAVLIAIFVGSHVCGILGMLLALPVLMTFRTAYRIFVQRHENV